MAPYPGMLSSKHLKNSDAIRGANAQRHLEQGLAHGNSETLWLQPTVKTWLRTCWTVEKGLLGPRNGLVHSSTHFTQSRREKIRPPEVVGGNNVSSWTIQSGWEPQAHNMAGVGQMLEQAMGHLDLGQGRLKRLLKPQVQKWWSIHTSLTLPVVKGVFLGSPLEQQHKSSMATVWLTPPGHSLWYSSLSNTHPI